MTREIKFRAWDKHDERMIEFGWIAGIFPDLRMSEETNGQAIEDTYEVMQFTGLKDKNGQEIYEGDVMRLHCGSEDGATTRHKIVGQVVWDKDRFTVAIPDKEVVVKGGSQAGNVLSWREIHTWVGMHTCLLEWTSKLEVIGNIYENPSLLQ